MYYIHYTIYRSGGHENESKKTEQQYKDHDYPTWIQITERVRIQARSELLHGAETSKQ
jgi:hypothetical protein